MYVLVCIQYDIGGLCALCRNSPVRDIKFTPYIYLWVVNCSCVYVLEWSIAVVCMYVLEWSIAVVCMGSIGQLVCQVVWARVVN